MHPNAPSTSASIHYCRNCHGTANDRRLCRCRRIAWESRKSNGRLQPEEKLLVLFAGDTKKSVLIDAAIASPDYFKNAVLVFGERNGNFSGFQSNLNSLHKQYQTTISTTSICGYSSACLLG